MLLPGVAGPSTSSGLTTTPFSKEIFSPDFSLPRSGPAGTPKAFREAGMGFRVVAKRSIVVDMILWKTHNKGHYIYMINQSLVVLMTNAAATLASKKTLEKRFPRLG